LDFPARWLFGHTPNALEWACTKMMATPSSMCFLRSRSRTRLAVSIRET
jgi:hypothetical protein